MARFGYQMTLASVVFISHLAEYEVSGYVMIWRASKIG